MRFPVRDPNWEDLLLAALWAERKQAGWWLMELPVGYSKKRSQSDRRIDAVVLPDSPEHISSPSQDLEKVDGAVDGKPVELIEAKGDLDIDVIGQLLCGASMFSRRYPNHGQLKLTAVVEHADDAALRWYCDAERIEVVEVAPEPRA